MQKNTRKWIFYAIILFLTVPALISLLNEPEPGLDRNRADSQQSGYGDFHAGDKALEPLRPNNQEGQHQIPRKQYTGTNYAVEEQTNQDGLKEKKAQDTQVSSRAMDRVLAADLSLTTSLFISQIEEQLEHWSKADVSQQEARDKFRAEVQKHKHFHSFGLVQDGQLEVEKGELNQAKLDELIHKNKNATSFRSDPYLSGEKQVMMLGKKHRDKWVVGEIDLSFLKGFVGELASVADANGNFFISSDEEKDVQWQKAQEQGSQGSVTQTVPELDWQIVIHSKDQGEASRAHYHQNEVLAQFESEASAEEWKSQQKEYQIKEEFGRFVVVAHPRFATEELITKLEDFPQIIKVEPNYIFTKQEGGQHSSPVRNKMRIHDVSTGKIPNDEFFKAYQWNLEQIRAQQGWEVSEGSEQVLIAFLDTGIDRNHEDLGDKIEEGYNTFDKSNDVTDYHGHGTHVAGIIGALTNNLTGIAGTSWKNPLLPIKVLDENGEGSIFEIASGIIWATDQGAKVINMSLGDSEHSELLYDAIRYAYERDVVLIAAAGNDNLETPMYPSAYEEVIAVAAVNEQEEKAEFSNYGPHIDVSAPGEHIPSTFVDDQYVFMSGTSMASPHVAGFAGLLRSLRPDLSNDEIMEVIKITAKDLGVQGHDPYYGYGLINIQAAMEYLEHDKESLQEEEQQQAPVKKPPSLQDWFRKLFSPR